jgi:hypothetical protein
MSHTLPIHRLVRRKESLRMPQERFLEGGGDSGIPTFGHGQPRKTGFAANVIISRGGRRCGRCRPCGRKRTRPQATWKLHKPQFSTAPTPITVSHKRKRNNEERCKCANLIVSTEGFTPRLCAGRCASWLRRRGFAPILRLKHQESRLTLAELKQREGANALVEGHESRVTWRGSTGVPLVRAPRSADR